MMSEHIGTLPNMEAMKFLRAEFDTFVEATKRCDSLTQEMQAAFKSWGGLVQQLREIILHTQEKAGEAAWKPEQGIMLCTYPVDSTPAASISSLVLPELPRPPKELVILMIQASQDDVLWDRLSCVEMWLRRCYMFFSGDGTGCGLDWKYVASTEGQQYLEGMLQNIEECSNVLKTSESAKKAGIVVQLWRVLIVREYEPIRHAHTDKESSGSVVQYKDHLSHRIPMNRRIWCQPVY